jgi:hypothetical protein
VISLRKQSPLWNCRLLLSNGVAWFVSTKTNTII